MNISSFSAADAMEADAANTAEARKAFLIDLMPALGITDRYLTEEPSEKSESTSGIDFIDVSKGRVTNTISFNPAGYLRLNPDVMAAGIPPLRHYITHGREEGRPFAENVSGDEPLTTIDRD